MLLKPQLAFTTKLDNCPGRTSDVAAKPATKDWTVAIELGASVPGYESHPKSWGAERQLEELQKLAKQTEGKSVNFIIHAELPVDAKGKPCDLGDVSKDAQCTTRAESANRARTQRYFIHDGKIEQLPDAKYKDGGDDIKSLLQDAAKLAPSEKLGLIVQSHGLGSDGIATNLGRISLNKTVDSIKAGLKESHRKDLDLLDFDACDMGAAKVMDKIHDIAKDVVASAAAEGIASRGKG